MKGVQGGVVARISFGIILDNCDCLRSKASMPLLSPDEFGLQAFEESF